MFDPLDMNNPGWVRAFIVIILHIITPVESFTDTIRAC